MIEELPTRNDLLVPLKFKRYYEVINDRVRIFGNCEVTEKKFEMFVSSGEFFKYLIGDVNIGQALYNTPKELREFLLSGISPEGWKILWNIPDEEDERENES